MDLQTPVRESLTAVATFVPRLLGFLVLLLVGYVVAKLVAKLVDKVLKKAGFDRAMDRGGITKALSASRIGASDIVAKLVFFAVFVPFLSAAVSTLGIPALQQPMAAFISLIPKIVVALVLVVAGVVLAGMARSFIANALGGLSYGPMLGTAAGVLILFGFLKAALDEVGVATTVTTALLYTLFATVAGVVIVGVGGGLVVPMQHRWESILNKADREKDRIRSAQAQAPPTAPPTSPPTAPPTTPPTTPHPDQPTTPLPMSVDVRRAAPAEGAPEVVQDPADQGRDAAWPTSTSPP